MDLNEIEKLTQLAKINLEKDEKYSLLNDLRKILEYVDQIKNSQIKEDEIVFFHKNVVREDEIKSEFNNEKIIEEFPEKENNYLKVPKVL